MKIFVHLFAMIFADFCNKKTRFFCERARKRLLLSLKCYFLIKTIADIFRAILRFVILCFYDVDVIPELISRLSTWLIWLKKRCSRTFLELKVAIYLMRWIENWLLHVDVFIASGKHYAMSPKLLCECLEVSRENLPHDGNKYKCGPDKQA